MGNFQVCLDFLFSLPILVKFNAPSKYPLCSTMVLGCATHQSLKTELQNLAFICTTFDLISQLAKPTWPNPALVGRAELAVLVSLTYGYVIVTATVQCELDFISIFWQYLLYSGYRQPADGFGFNRAIMQPSY